MKTLSSAVLLILFLTIQGFAQINFNKEGKSSIDAGISYSSSSSFYDLKGKQRIYTKDTFNLLLNGITPYSYNLKRTFELSKYILFLGYSYSLTDDMLVSAEIPFSIISLNEKYELDTNSFSPSYGVQKVINNFSVFQPEYYRINWNYRLMKGVYNPIVKVSVILPPKLSNGYQNSDTSKYKYYSAYQFYLGIINNFTFDKSFIELETGYFHKTGQFNKSLFIRFDGGISSVENTSLHGIILWNQNLGGFDNVLPASPSRTTLAETSLDIGAVFNILIAKQYLVDFGYLVRLGMTNTLSDGRFHLKTSILLD